MTSSNEPLPTDRNKLIDTAVLFLQGSKVRTTPLELKKKFLRKKGLTDDEINIACDRAGFNTFAQLDTNGNNHVSLSVNHQIQHPLTLSSKWTVFKEIANSFAIIGGFLYVLYLFYKKFIKPWLFRSSPKERSLETAIEDVEKLAIDSKNEVHKLNDSLVKISDSQNSTKTSLTYQINELKSEVTSLKGLLLNRKQFPATPAVSAPVRIPAWQLSAEDGAEEGGNGSGSGASDAEISNANGSDSSLEMIRSCNDNSLGNENN